MTDIWKSYLKEEKKEKKQKQKQKPTDDLDDQDPTQKQWIEKT